MATIAKSSVESRVRAIRRYMKPYRRHWGHGASSVRRMGVALAVLAFAAIMAAWSPVAFAATYTLKDGATDWTQPGSYDENDVDPSTFTSADEIRITTNATAYLDLSAEAGVRSLAVANSVGRIVPLATNSVLDVTVDEGDAFSLKVPFTYTHVVSTAVFNGEIVKRGAGELELDVPGATTKDLQTKLTVKAGTLVMPQAWGQVLCYTTVLTVDEGATLVTASGADGDGRKTSTIYRTLNGAGTVTNRSTDAAFTFEVFSNNKSQCGTFTGRITGPITIFNYGHVNLLGTASDTTEPFRMQGNDSAVNYETHVAKLADAGEPSSIGAGPYSIVQYLGHTLVYDGAGGDSINRGWRVNSFSNPFVLDAGAAGGLSLTGAWRWYEVSNDQKEHAVRQVVLTGSNTQECVIGGPMSDFRHQTTNVTAHFTKRGSGTWRFKTNWANVHGGVLAVEAGTLKYDSLERADYASALGISTVLKENDGTDVEYAFRLGGGKAKRGDADEPTFAYAGTNDVWCGDRPFAVKSDARIVNDTTNCLHLANAYGLGSGAKTLTFGGSCMESNEFWNVSDGEGTLAVRKTGAGNWTLSGNLDFSGGISVEGGSLVMRKVTDTQYTWYRWTLRQSNGEKYFQIENLSLFSEGKVCQTAGFTATDDWRRIQPGQAAIARSDATFSLGVNNKPITLKNLFTTTNDYGFSYGIIPYGTNEMVQTVANNTTTHIPIILRLTNGTPDIVAFDYVNVWGSNNSTSAKRSLKAYTLEGSLNGFVWETLYTTNDAPVATASRQWSTVNSGWQSSTPPAYAIPARTQTTYAMPANPGPVSVKGGGALKAEGGSPEISALSLDAASGGTIDGFAFAADGTLDVANLPVDARVTLPVTLVNAASSSNIADWTVSVNGTSAAALTALVDAGGHVVVCRRGLRIIVR